MHKVIVFLMIVAAFVSSLPLQIFAEEDGALDTDLNLGFSLNDGNSETMQANAALTTEGQREDLGSLRAGVEFNYGESTVDDERETTLEDHCVFAGTRKTLSRLGFLSLNADYLHDEVAEIEYRATLSPGAGSYVFKGDDGSLSFELGPSYIWEEVAGQSDDYLALRIMERFEYKIGPNAKCWQSLEYMPRADDFDDYLINAELGVEAALNSRLNLRVSLKDQYDSTPGAGNEENDISLISGISISI